ncbi:hypothetical protein [Sphingomonas sp.]|uniref:hypothetical protein n=1 Tax=Sphingomonas sp. TaxID=28214 RepID=UPI0025FCB774|nr:hypothetical protein [Sphingomonas sp.]MBV9528658.1 hypothetical protein [Sphingomonas sp.]
MRTIGRLALAGTAVALMAPSAPKTLDPAATVREHVQPITRVSATGFSGPAWDALVADGAGAQFTMVGEQHGSGSIALFETALHRELARRGYTHSAYEVGPYSARFAESLIRSGDGRLAQYIAAPGHGFTIPFFFFGEESKMAEDMVRMSPDKHEAIFGLDQEFVGSGPILGSDLQAMARNDGQKRAVAAFQAASAADPMFIGKISDAQVASLDEAFRGNPEAEALIDAIRTSARIYKPFITGVGTIYDANLERENYMKMNFIRQFAAAARRNGKAPKVFFKFGGYHAMRGFSGTDVPALTNFLSEWGRPQGYRVMNLLVDCIGGQAMNPQTNKPEACESYFGDDSILRQTVANGPPVQVVDLRALRPLLPKLKLDNATRTVVLAFDYYVAIRDGVAATPLGALPATKPKA